MEQVSKIPDGKKLFHYSTPPGLLGMLESKCLWFSNIHYLNDSREYYYIFDLLKRVLEEGYHAIVPQKYLSVIKEKERTRNNYDEPAWLYETDTDYWTNINMILPVFSFSLTEKKDILSQWRGYCPDGGYSFSFDSEQLNDMMREYRLEIKKCLYDDTEQRKFIRDEVIGVTPENYVLAFTDQTPFGLPPALDSMKYMYARASRYAPLFKHYKFKEEREWRIIKDYNKDFSERILMDQNPALELDIVEKRIDIKFRYGKNTIIPYLQIPFLKYNEKGETVLDEYNNKIKTHIKIPELVIGPGPQKELNEQACKTMLNMRIDGREGNTKIVQSKVPYRNW
ncbi:DUF2971 domain-containing protein [Hymenobacter aerilatus]|uniref:DUF2971 domain-containing protein n=1 Tax=Hymenobacter aerilatus TaxID=2932251 RepID=A0A8T9ST19_9BACT|nr:DUF2971 domain-containing protein [Hymenobacter aerilatus]UOR03873.1 DUF2971 domain-containing protein [Hymenobacter aerilatus]